jgi:hypothetical protein
MHNFQRRIIQDCCFFKETQLSSSGVWKELTKEDGGFKCERGMITGWGKTTSIFIQKEDCVETVACNIRGGLEE